MARFANPDETGAGGSPGAGVTPEVSPVKRYWPLAVLALTFLFVLMPFLFWQSTWFGKPLSDSQLQESLADSEHPREIQHALSQITDRILSDDPAARDSARQFYPEVVRIAGEKDDQLRLTAAWVMGQDNSVPEFRQELFRLLQDRNPMVRRNAALALVRFGDTTGQDEIRSMFQPYAVSAPHAGKMAERLKSGETVNPGMLLGWIEAGGERMELRSPVPGSIRRWLVANDEAVSDGQPVLLIDPSPGEIWEALRALYLIGEPQDLPAVEKLARADNGIPDNVRDQAQRTASAIQARASGNIPPSKVTTSPQSPSP